MEASHELRLVIRSKSFQRGLTWFIQTGPGAAWVGILAEALARLGYGCPKVETDFDLSPAVLEQPPRSSLEQWSCLGVVVSM